MKTTAESRDFYGKTHCKKCFKLSHLYLLNIQLLSGLLAMGQWRIVAIKMIFILKVIKKLLKFNSFLHNNFFLDQSAISGKKVTFKENILFRQ